MRVCRCAEGGDKGGGGGLQVPHHKNGGGGGPELQPKIPAAGAGGCGGHFGGVRGRRVDGEGA